jgi:hypothetical protein
MRVPNPSGLSALVNQNLKRVHDLTQLSPVTLFPEHRRFHLGCRRVVLVDVHHRTKNQPGRIGWSRFCGTGVDDAPLGHHHGNQEVGRRVPWDVEPPGSAVVMRSFILSVQWQCRGLQVAWLRCMARWRYRTEELAAP